MLKRFFKSALPLSATLSILLIATQAQADLAVAVTPVICLSGAGTSTVDGTYYRGVNSYAKQDNSYFITMAAWNLVNANNSFYYTGNSSSTSVIPTTGWTTLSIGSLPVPTIVACSAPTVSAPVDSPLALSLVFLGIAAVAGFQRWRKRV